MTTVYVMTEGDRFEPVAFSSEEKLLDYFRWLYPKAKNLRTKKMGVWGRIKIFNHNNLVTEWHQQITEIILDSALKEQDHGR